MSQLLAPLVAAGWDLRDPLTTQAIEELELRSGIPFPPPIRETLLQTSGATFDSSPAVFDLSGTVHRCSFDLLPLCLPLLSDGSGNYWVVDCHGMPQTNPVVYLSHDPPVVLYEFPDIPAFLNQLAEHGFANTAKKSNLQARQIAERQDSATPNRELDPRMLPDEVQEFLRSVPPGSLIYDFRSASIPFGFLWSYTGFCELHRCQGTLVFSVKDIPEPRQPLLQQLLSLPRLIRFLFQGPPGQ